MGDTQFGLEKAKTTNIYFFFTILFLVFDYGRPQDILGIGSIRPSLIIGLILSLFLIKHKDISIYKEKSIKFIFYFIILLFIYIPFARHRYLAWIAAELMIIQIPFILSIIANISTLERLKKLIFVLILLMNYVSIYSLMHKGQGSGNYFQDENDIALFINMYIPFCFYLMVYNKRKKIKLFYAISLVIGVSAVVLSFSRGGFLGLIGIGVIIWLYSPKKIFTLAVLVCLGLGIYFFSGQNYKNEMITITERSNIDEHDDTAKSRIESWKAGWRIFVNHPFGVGGNNFGIYFPDYQSQYFTHNMWGRAAHSLWFTLLPELGLIGIWIYFTLLYYNLKNLYFLKNISRVITDPEDKYFYYLSLSMLASFAGYFISGTFLSVLYYPHYWYLTGVIVAICNIVKKIDDKTVLQLK
jgi:putative inorganic carbon (hco3(-)) transporter